MNMPGTICLCAQLFMRPNGEELKTHMPEFTIVAAPEFQADPKRDGTRLGSVHSGELHPQDRAHRRNQYAGEMKKSIFGVMNFLLPQRNVFPMHCSANVGHRRRDARCSSGSPARARPRCRPIRARFLIGDDEHGWSADGVFNFEGGCYAKCIKLSKKNEPQIWNAIRFGSVLENVTLDPETRVPDYNDDSRTENTRAAYPVDYIDNAVIPGRRRASEERHLSYRRRVRRAASDFEADAGAGDVSLSVRLHREGCGN